MEGGRSVTLGPETADVWAGRRVGSQVRQQTLPRLCTVKSLSLGVNPEILGVRLVRRSSFSLRAQTRGSQRGLCMWVPWLCGLLYIVDKGFFDLT